MTFMHPWVLLLLLPVGMFLFAKRTLFSTTVVFFRALSAALLILALSEPYWTFGKDGLDMVVVVDRSSSMPTDIDQRAMEVIKILQEKQADGDRLAVLSITKHPQVEHPFSDTHPFQGFQPVKQADNSQLNDGLQLALDLISPNRAGRVLLITDGENTGQVLDSSRKEAQSRGIPIHIRYLPQSRLDDVSITSLSYPKQSSKGDPVQISAWIDSPTEQTVQIVLRRNDEIIASGNKQLSIGNNSISLIDTPKTGGINQYELEIQTEKDQRRENNRAVFGTLVNGPKRILLLTHKGKDSSLERVLTQNNMAVDLLDPTSTDLNAAFLTRYQAIILQNIPSTEFTTEELRAIAMYVEDLGGGLLMTGGRTSFAAGGYLHTPIEALLPVQLEIREEHRKIGLALGIALDRSGSMSVGVGPNLTKMDLANQGASAALSLLTAIDSTAVYAVDTEAHKILSLQDVQNSMALSRKVLGIQSQGGGIYVGAALDQMLLTLSKAKQKNRHVALFADANDAVENNDVFSTIEQMRAENITISVIALGTPTDSDAKFLANVALKGGGDIYFTTNPAELPKLFAMDTMLASKSAFSDTPTMVETVLGATGLGGQRFPNPPTIEGHNITYFKSTAQVGYRSKDTDPVDPLLTHHQYGLGKTVAYMGQIDGPYGQNITAWANYAPLFHSILLAISTTQPPSLPYVGVEQDGHRQLYTVESTKKVPQATLVLPNGQEKQIPFVEVDDDLYQAQIEQSMPGIHVMHVKSEDGSVLLPPTSLPYSNEFQPRSSMADQRTLQRLARLTNGQINGSIDLLFEGSRESKSLQSLQVFFTVLGLLFFLLEIADRRLRILSAVSIPRRLTLKTPKILTPAASSSRPSGPSSEPSGPEQDISTPQPAPTLQDALRKAKQRSKRG